MVDTSVGMSPDPFGATSLRSRLVCAKCFTEPAIKKATSQEGMIELTVACHGKEETAILQKADLVFTKRFFEADAEKEG